MIRPCSASFLPLQKLSRTISVSRPCTDTTPKLRDLKVDPDSTDCIVPCYISERVDRLPCYTACELEPIEYLRRSRRFSMKKAGNGKSTPGCDHGTWIGPAKSCRPKSVPVKTPMLSFSECTKGTVPPPRVIGCHFRQADR